MGAAAYADEAATHGGDDGHAARGGHSGGGHVRGMARMNGAESFVNGFAARRGFCERAAIDRMTAIAHGMAGKRLRHVELGANGMILPEHMRVGARNRRDD